MPAPGMRWRHVILNTRCSWLHGDPRGYRDRNHRTHSSGDYRKPPPKGEHEGLHDYYRNRSKAEITFDRDLRPIIGRAMTAHFQTVGYRTLVVAVTKVHAHALVELPNHILKIRAIIGQAKRASSRAIKDRIPGSIWAAGGTYKLINDSQHHHNVYEYILYDQGPGAWTWSFKDATHDGAFARKRTSR